MTVTKSRPGHPKPKAVDRPAIECLWIPKAPLRLKGFTPNASVEHRISASLGRSKRRLQFTLPDTSGASTWLLTCEDYCMLSRDHEYHLE